MARMIDPLKRESWRRRLAAFEQGNLSVAEFCRRARVSVASFYQWRRKLQTAAGVPDHEKGTEGLTVRRADRSGFGARETVPRVSFVPVEITGRANIEVYLPNGARLLVPCHDREAIRAVIAAVANDRREDSSC